MNHPAFSYLAPDRLAALAAGRDLPADDQGAALTVDISGFTPLTERLAVTLGERRGADELAAILNTVYELLISRVEAWGGSVISFSGDAMHCWFSQNAGAAAVGCAAAIQAALADATSGELALAVTCAIVSGSVHRLRLGDERIQYIDTLAGPAPATLAWLERIARPGEIIVDSVVTDALSSLTIEEWRDGDRPGRRGAIVRPIPAGVPAGGGLALAPASPAPELARPWVPPAVWERLQWGAGEFITELRPAVALFGAIDVPGGAGQASAADLDAYVRWVQAVVVSYAGTLLQLTVAEQGVYFYVAFGAPVSHEDDTIRAIMVARALQEPPDALALGDTLRLGLSAGIMRTGAYGSATRRTYGVLGDHVNLAARLMQRGRPGDVLASASIQQASAARCRWEPLEPMTLKGKSAPVGVYRLAGMVDQPPVGVHPAAYRLPLIGRAAELDQVAGLIADAGAGRGRVIRILGEPGIGKSRLLAALLEQALAGDWTVYAGECQSYSATTPYAVWQPIWQALFEIDPAAPPAVQARQMASAIERIDPSWLARLPLLSPVLNLDLPDTDLTRSFEPQLRNESREALLVDWFRAWAGRSPTGGALVVLEDVHWMDASSASLLVALSRVISALPVAFVLVQRDQDGAAPSARLPEQIEGMADIALAPLAEHAVGELIAATLERLDETVEGEARTTLLAGMAERTQGNPFYIEELLTYLHTRGADLRDAGLWARADLPTSLHSLILSRIDQLGADQQHTIKVASVVGRLFRVAWLHGAHPDLGTEAALAARLETLGQADLTVREPLEPELAYLFKHVITRDVAYESLAFATRAALHERLADYLEALPSAGDPQMIYLIAYHYERGRNDIKKREYLRRAGETAQAAYANETAIAYYERLLPLLDNETDILDTLTSIGDICTLIGEIQKAIDCYQQLINRAEAGFPRHYANGLCQMGNLLRAQKSSYAEAITMLSQAVTLAQSIGDQDIEGRAMLGLSKAYIAVGSFKLSLYLAANLLERAKKTNDQLNMAGAWLLGAEAKLVTGQSDGVLEELKQALELYEARDQHQNIANVYISIARLLYTQGNLTECLRYVQQAADVFGRIGDRGGQTKAICNHGVLLNEFGDKAGAAARYQEALSLAKAIGNDYMHCIILMNITVVLEPSYDDAEYLDYASAAVDMAEKINNQELYVVALNGKADVLRALGRTEEALKCFEQGIERARKMNYVLELCRGMVFYGKLLRETGNSVAAHAILRDGLSLAHSTNNKLGMRKGFIYVANLLEITDDPSIALDSVRVIAALEKEVTAEDVNLHSDDMDLYYATVEKLKSSSDSALFNQLWSDGVGITLEEAIGMALAWQSPEMSAAPEATG